MQNPEVVCDELTNQAAVKAITRGGRQAADSAAMNAMFDALNAEVSKEEAGKIFSNTYIQFLNNSHERK